jgi:subtilisin family serine protease
MDTLMWFVTRYIHKPPHSFEDAVKIAVLDTGIDLNHPTIKGAVNMRRIKTSKSFVKDDKTPQDENGHGTHVASLILKVAPESELYVGKIARNENIPSDHDIAWVGCDKSPWS